MRNDAWLYRGWVKCYSCGYMEEIEQEGDTEDDELHNHISKEVLIHQD